MERQVQIVFAALLEEHVTLPVHCHWKQSWDKSRPWSRAALPSVIRHTWWTSCQFTTSFNLLLGKKHAVVLPVECCGSCCLLSVSLRRSPSYAFRVPRDSNCSALPLSIFEKLSSANDLYLCPIQAAIRYHQDGCLQIHAGDVSQEAERCFALLAACSLLAIPSTVHHPSCTKAISPR